MEQDSLIQYTNLNIFNVFVDFMLYSNNI